MFSGPQTALRTLRITGQYLQSRWSTLETDSTRDQIDVEASKPNPALSLPRPPSLEPSTRTMVNQPISPPKGTSPTVARISERGEVVCPCGYEARLVQSFKDNANYGKLFYKCGYFYENGVGDVVFKERCSLFGRSNAIRGVSSSPLTSLLLAWLEDLEKKAKVPIVLPNDGVPINGIGTVSSSEVSHPPPPAPPSSPSPAPRHRNTQPKIYQTKEEARREEHTSSSPLRKRPAQDSFSSPQRRPSTPTNEASDEEEDTENESFQDLLKKKLWPGLEEIDRVVEGTREELAEARKEIKGLNKRNRILERRRKEHKETIMGLQQRVEELEEQRELMTSQDVTQ